MKKLVLSHLPLWVVLMAGPQLAPAYDWLPPTNKIAVLAVWAHPDDEGIAGGGSLPYYSAVLDVPTMLICMTHGWGDIRDDELRCAAWTYGMRYEPLFGQFADINSGGVTNNPYTNTIDMTWDYWAGVGFQGDGSDVEAGKARAINYVAEQIRRYRPDVILTHDVNGETGHDNHKATAYAVINAFSVAADPNATATNLVGLPPWQAKKLYVHLYPTNRLFHEFWETPFPSLTNQTPRQAAATGLMCHVSQGPDRWIVASVYNPTYFRSAWPSEWWGLYASTVGPDTVLTNDTTVMGYPVPAGVAAENFLEHLAPDIPPHPPVFTSHPLTLPPVAVADAYLGQSLADYAYDWDRLAWNPSQTLTFSVNSGPAWLTVAADGTLSGTPSAGDAGTNVWAVQVTDGAGLTDGTTLMIKVVARPPGLEDLVGWWKLDDTNPPVVRNSAPLSPNGTSSGGVTFGQSGVRPWTGASALFDGTDAKADVSYVSLLNPPVFTVSLWVQATGGDGTYRSPLTSRQRVSQPSGVLEAGYFFYAGNNNLWQFWTGSGTNWNILTAGPVVNNTWVHLVGTYDGTTISFYTNGKLAASMAAPVQPNQAFPLRIGAGSTEGAGQYWFPGFIDDVRIYRAALTSAQVWALYASTPPKITGLTRLDDGSMQVEGMGVPDQTCVLLAATNQAISSAWVPLSATVADTNGYIRIADPAATNFVQRFYRLIAP